MADIVTEQRMVLSEEALQKILLEWSEQHLGQKWDSVYFSGHRAYFKRTVNTERK